jgi:hypothetical protein
MEYDDDDDNDDDYDYGDDDDDSNIPPELQMCAIGKKVLEFSF